MLADEGMIGVIQMEVPRELVGGGVADEAAVSICLIAGQEPDRHRWGLRRNRGFWRGLAEEISGALAW